MHPQTIPIIDVRTVEVLFKAGLLSTDQRDLAHYEEFRQAIERLGHLCPSWSLRQIDRALFAYHKQCLNEIGGESPSRCSSSYAESPAEGRSRYAATIGQQVRHTGKTNHDRFASVFRERTGRIFATAEIVKLMSTESDIQFGSILPNDHGEGNKGECPCVATDRQIFNRIGHGKYRVRDFRS
jgi:hypothetical protein